MEDHPNISERVARPTGRPRSVRSALVLVFVSACILYVVCIARIYPSDAQRKPEADPLVAISDMELVKHFRQAVDSYDNMTDEFRGCVLEIERRRLLADLSPEQIRELLGEPDAKDWVYLDQQVLETMNPLKRLFAKRGSSWTFFHRSEIEETHFLMKVVNERTVIYVLAFDGQELAWTSFVDEVGIDIIEEKEFYYAMDPLDQEDP